jgi:hypothetical protein
LPFTWAPARAIAELRLDEFEFIRANDELLEAMTATGTRRTRTIEARRMG